MRRLPVYFVLDCSESMVGEKLRQMQEALHMIVQSLRTDPHALETVYLSVLAFAGTARVVAPLIEIASFYPPHLPLGSGTHLGEALGLLIREMDRSLIRTTAEAKGDWKPIVYLFTDGCPTDDPRPEVERWKQKYAGKATLIIITLGTYADFETLRELTENVIVFEEKREGDFTKFISWVTASVAAQSKSVGEMGNDRFDLANLDESVMKLVKEPPPKVDDNCVVLVGRCTKTRKPYIIKYERGTMPLPSKDFHFEVPSNTYQLSGCYPLDEEYFDWSDERVIEQTVHTSALQGAPGCPHCGNNSAFAMCGCGKLLCVNGPGTVTCPWCRTQVRFADDSGGDFDVARGQG